MWLNLTGLIAIGLMVWRFWLYQTKSTAVRDGSMTARVKDGVCHPANITFPANESGQRGCVRENATPCAETLLFPELDISETLVRNTRVAVTIAASYSGHYPCHYQMSMYRGILVVK